MVTTTDLAILAFVVLADKAAYWSLLFCGRVRVSSPAAQAGRKTAPKGEPASQPDEGERLSILGGQSKGEVAA